MIEVLSTGEEKNGLAAYSGSCPSRAATAHRFKTRLVDPVFCKAARWRIVRAELIAEMASTRAARAAAPPTPSAVATCSEHGVFRVKEWPARLRHIVKR